MDRKEVAQLLNFNRYPVLTIDLADKIQWGFKGCKVRIPCGNYFLHAELEWFENDKKILITKEITIISNSFGYRDVLEMCEYANAPIIDAGQEIVLVVINSVKHTATAPIMLKIGKEKRFDRSQPISFENSVIDLKKRE